MKTTKTTRVSDSLTVVQSLYGQGLVLRNAILTQGDRGDWTVTTIGSDRVTHCATYAAALTAATRRVWA